MKSLLVIAVHFASALAVLAQVQTQPQRQVEHSASFEVASVKLMDHREKLPIEQQMYSMSPSGAGVFSVRNATLENLIAWAFRIGGNNQPIINKPSWMRYTYYEISARPEGGVGLNYDQLRPMLQELLRERFHLTYHSESKIVKGYALIVAKGGPKITPTKGAEQHAYLFPGTIDAVGAPLSLIAGIVSNLIGQPVADETGLKGSYDIKLEYAPMETTDPSRPSLLTAIQEQLGLKLVSREVPVEAFVIDHVDKAPVEN